MIKNTLLLPCVALLLALSLSSCLKDEVEVRQVVYTPEEYALISQVLNLPNAPTSFAVELPDHMQRLGMRAPRIDDAKALLGRVLFYDTKLSHNQSVSCASCHHQELAFSDNVRFSTGFDGQLTPRNSLALAATANFVSSYGGGSSFGPTQPQLFFWDERARTLQEQSALTIQDDIEMGMDMSELVQRLSKEEYYRVLFRRAYGHEAVHSTLITEALQEFMNSLVSTETLFDKGMALVNGDAARAFPNFTATENLGKSLFIQHCSSCHGANMSIAPVNVANNGLDAASADPGFGGVTGKPEDIGKFKVPFLRNVALSAPYMHDGRFATLAEVIEHYNSGIQAHPNLDVSLRAPNGSPRRLNLSPQEKDALLVFLNTLTDEALIKASRFSDPFK
jgi:cytochrome c peroxidase